MDCRYKYKGKLYTEEELEKELRKDGIIKDTISQIEDLSKDIKGIYKSVFKTNPMQALYEIAIQANSSPSEKNGATKTVGLDLVDLAQKTFPNAKTGDKYLQVEGEQLKQASSSTIKKIKEFNDRIGVKQENLNEIVVNGRKLGVNGVALPYEGLIQIVNGREETTLPEESMHIAVEILEQKNPGLFKQLLSDVNNYKITQDVISSYKEIKEYQLSDGKPDIVKLKKEAIAKVLAEHILSKEQGTETPEKIARTSTLWEKIKTFLKNLFSSASFNPFEEVSKQVLAEKPFEGDISDIGTREGEVYLQKEDETFNKIKDTNTTLAKKGIDYEVNGQKVANSLDKKVQDFLSGKYKEPTEYLKKREDFLKQSQSLMQVEMGNILGKYVDSGDGKLRDEYFDEEQISVISPYDNTFYQTLDKHLKERVESYIPGTRFLINKDIYDSKTNTAGRADFIALMPDGKVDILQFKLLSFGENRKNIPSTLQDAYNVELEGLKKIIEGGYGVSPKDINQARAIPIKAEYEGNVKDGFELVGMKIGNVDAKLEKDPLLLPVAAYSESTGSKKLDQQISKFRALYEQLRGKPVSPEEREKKTDRLSSLLGAIRELQVKKDASNLLSSARLIADSQKEGIKALKEKVDKTIPEAATIKEMNKVADEIDEAKRELAPYVDLYSSFKSAYRGENQEFIDKAKLISDDARDYVDELNEINDDFRANKFSKSVGIDDELDPEKNLTWYRKMIRSLSQSSIKSGNLLWQLVERNTNLFKTRYTDAITKLDELHKAVSEWKAGKTDEDLYKRIFQYDKNGRWTGRVINKIGRDFFEALDKAQSARNTKWVKENIDTEAYKTWYDEKITSLKQDNELARYHESDEENNKIKQERLNNFIRTFDISKKSGVNPDNYKIRQFPREEKWHSEQYKELLKTENKAVLDTWKHWDDVLQRSYNNGMFKEAYERYGFFPNVRKNWLEKLSTKEIGEGLFNPFSGIKIYPEDEAFGQIDPITGKSINQIHARFLTDLGRTTQDTDGNYYKDYSLKSMDLFKSMALWEREVTLFELREETEGLAKLIADTESRKMSLKTTNTGLLARVKGKKSEVIPVENTINEKYIQDMIDAYWYDKKLESDADIVFSIPWGSAAKSVNKFFGTKIFVEPEENSIQVSGIKALGAANRYFRTKTLGLNPLTALSNLFGGTSNLYIKAGQYFTKTDAFKASTMLVASKLGTEEGKTLAALIHHFKPELDDETYRDARYQSLSNMQKYLSSEWLFAMQRQSDHAVNYTAAISFFMNTLVKDGKLVNTREYVKGINNYDRIYDLPENERQAKMKDIERQIEDLNKNSPDHLLNVVKVEGNKINIPGVDLESTESIKYRQRILEYIKSVLGNSSSEDLSLYKRSVMWQSFFMFKNWIPRMIDERGQSLKYAPGTDKYEWGRIRILGNALRTSGLSSIAAITKQLSGNSGDIIKIAKKAYKEKQAYFKEQRQDFNLSEAQFIDQYTKGVSSSFKELGLATALMGIYIAFRINAPDKNEDPEVKGVYKYALRAIDKLQDELSFFYNPKSFTDIANGSVFPALGLLADAEKLFTNAARYGYNWMIGDQQALEKIKFRKYIYKDLPITKELVNYLAIFNADWAKDAGIKVQSQSGSGR